MGDFLPAHPAFAIAASIAITLLSIAFSRKSWIRRRTRQEELWQQAVYWARTCPPSTTNPGMSIGKIVTHGQLSQLMGVEHGQEVLVLTGDTMIALLGISPSTRRL